MSDPHSVSDLADSDFKRLVNLVNDIISISHDAARNGDARGHEIYVLSRDARDLLILDETSREAMRRLTSSDRPTMYGVTISKQVEDYVRSGMKIRAIKELRTESSLGLKEAKDIVEAFANTLGIG
jgi:N-acetylmuramoyl-L-alanine amidase